MAWSVARRGDHAEPGYQVALAQCPRDRDARRLRVAGHVPDESVGRGIVGKFARYHLCLVLRRAYLSMRRPLQETLQTACVVVVLVGDEDALEVSWSGTEAG